MLKMIAAGELKVPPRVDYLYVEQEVMADETPAVDAGERDNDLLTYNTIHTTSLYRTDRRIYTHHINALFYLTLTHLSSTIPLQC